MIIITDYEKETITVLGECTLSDIVDKIRIDKIMDFKITIMDDEPSSTYPDSFTVNIV